MGTVDFAAHGAPLMFRILMIPGAALMWPVMAVKWRRASNGARSS
jgi:hypothetical protein